MYGNRLKYLFITLALLLLLFMLKGGSDAGISGDEYLHYDQSVSVYNYFSSLGKDTSALNTPNTHLKYYGQSFDNLTTILIRWFGIDDIFLFRHLLCSIAGWLTILITAFFAIWLEGYMAGILVLLLFALSPTFLGHAQNNLKDIPFALSYIAAIFFTLKFFFHNNKPKTSTAIILAISIAFSISIRSGGLILICYLFLFLILYTYYKYHNYNNIDWISARKQFLRIMLISVVALILGIILWPYGQQNPFQHILKSYQVMSQFPTTIRQLFEGKMEWSDLMPWYYLPKYMAITIPLLVIAGVVSFVLLSKKIIRQEKILKYGFVVFSILFPIIFVIYEKSNLYGSWRHFLFVYPSIILLSAIGILYLFKYLNNKFIQIILLLFSLGLAIHPLKYMLLNHPYYYMYYNQMVGGLNGAYGNYETDYYYHTIRQGSEWLNKYLESNKQTGDIRVATNFSVKWYFRNRPNIHTAYCQYDQRSQIDWDYMIVANSYIAAELQQNKTWPPKNAIYVIYADQVPVGAVLKRETKLDQLGYESLIKGDFSQSARLFYDALKINAQDELIFYNFATALVKEGKIDSAKVVLESALKINPGYEPILMYLGNIALKQNNPKQAIQYFETLIGCNRKYNEAYVALSKLLMDSNMAKARGLLKTCLTMDPGYKPAIMSLADSYRKSDPEIAKKYDELANTYK